MERMTVENLDMKRLLPGWMEKDETDAALAKAMTELFLPVGQTVDTLRIWDQVDNLDNDMLDELAWEMDIDWWDSTWDLESKRNTIKTAKQTQHTRGTRYAVQQLIDSAFGGGEIEEWFEYGGTPNTFKVTVGKSLDDEGIKDFLARLKKIKNVKSTLDGIVVPVDVSGTVYAGGNYSEHSVTTL